MVFFQTMPVKYKTELYETLELQAALGNANFCRFFFSFTGRTRGSAVTLVAALRLSKTKESWLYSG
jgi:hypothetical protein